jgi:hypothetical protein
MQYDLWEAITEYNTIYREKDNTYRHMSMIRIKYLNYYENQVA